VDRAFPHVPVAVDEAGHRDHVVRVEHLRIVRCQVRSDGCDARALDQHIALREIADGAIDARKPPATSAAVPDRISSRRDMPSGTRSSVLA
jgi:hypothetical protein